MSYGVNGMRRVGREGDSRSKKPIAQPASAGAFRKEANHGNELFRCIASQDGIILYETISLCIMKDSPMVAYGIWDFTKHGEVVKNCIVCGEAEHKRHHHHKKSEIDED